MPHAEERERITLEEKIAFLERTIDAMSDVALEQSRRLDALEKQIEGIEGKLATADEGEQLRPHDDPPPHY